MDSVQRSRPVHVAGDHRVVLEALRSHVPLTLLMDLGEPDGPASVEIAETEGGDADWLLAPAARSPRGADRRR